MVACELTPCRQAHIEARGGEVRLSAPVKEIQTNEDGTVSGLLMRDGSVVKADVRSLEHTLV